MQGIQPPHAPYLGPMQAPQAPPPFQLEPVHPDHGPAVHHQPVVPPLTILQLMQLQHGRHRAGG